MMASAVEARRERILQEHTRRGGTRLAKVGEARTLILWDRRNRHPQAPPTVIEVVVSAACPVKDCGKLRGEPKIMKAWDVWSQTENPLSVWRNPCGHVDMHADVIEEAERYRLQEGA
jgi:hypothetical protein